MNTVQLDQTYIADTYNRFPVEIVSGRGCTAVDANGKEYIDLGSAIAVNTFGIADEAWKKAVIAQLDNVQSTSNLYYSVPQTRLAEMLCQRTGMKKVFFGNSGAEANECMIKVIRKYASDKYGENARPVIITLQNSFHGRTITTLSATGQDVFHHHVAPFTPGFIHVPANDSSAMQKALDEYPVAGVMMEMVQGEGGVCALDKEYVKESLRMCRERDVIFGVDEVQTGNGRTGTLYAFEQFDIVPDVFSTAKGLGGGLPIGACLMSEKTENVLTRGSHGSTFGGNPVSCAGAVSILERIDEACLADVRKKAAYFRKGIAKLPGVKSVSGLGLMIGIETEKPARELVDKGIEQGVLMMTAKAKIRLLPALNITMEEIDRALEIMKRVMEA